MQSEEPRISAADAHWKRLRQLLYIFLVAGLGGGAVVLGQYLGWRAFTVTGFVVTAAAILLGNVLILAAIWKTVSARNYR